MKILVINGDCLQVNTSANLCHLAYLRGLVEEGHEITLLSADGDDYPKDPSMVIPPQIHRVSYYGKSLYEKLAERKKNGGTAPGGAAAAAPAPRKTLKQRAVKAAKKLALSLYGVHGIYASFLRKAGRFHSDERYDYVLSLSTPVTSHLLAHRLISAGRVKCGRWIQIWEDPWYADAFGFNRKPSVLREERRLLSFSESVCYVSPITLENQKQLFPESADKMFWEPLPSYYNAPEAKEITDELPVFGYFGDYYSWIRNLEPFYEAANHLGAECNICGNSGRRFESTEKIHVYPRLPLEELRPFEERTSVLVFLCNRAGGQIPGKIYQYSATGKTVLFILDGTEAEKTVLREYFEPFHRYVFCDNTVESIEDAMRRIMVKEVAGIVNEPLTQFEPRKIVRRILQEG